MDKTALFISVVCFLDELLPHKSNSLWRWGDGWWLVEVLLLRNITRDVFFQLLIIELFDNLFFFIVVSTNYKLAWDLPVPRPIN